MKFMCRNCTYQFDADCNMKTCLQCGDTNIIPIGEDPEDEADQLISILRQIHGELKNIARALTR